MPLATRGYCFLSRIIRRNFRHSFQNRSDSVIDHTAKSDGESESSLSKVVDNGRSFRVNRNAALLLNYPRFIANCRGIRARSGGSPDIIQVCLK